MKKIIGLVALIVMGGVAYADVVYIDNGNGKVSKTEIIDATSEKDALFADIESTKQKIQDYQQKLIDANQHLMDVQAKFDKLNQAVPQNP